MAHVVALVLTLAVVAPAAADMKILEPHDPTWERIFKISWQMDEKKGRPIVEGYIVNASPYTILYHRGRPHAQRPVELAHGWAAPATADDTAARPLRKRHYQSQALDGGIEERWVPRRRKRCRPSLSTRAHHDRDTESRLSRVPHGVLAHDRAVGK